MPQAAKLEQIQFLLDHVSVQTTESDVGQAAIEEAVNYRIGIELSRFVIAAIPRIHCPFRRVQDH